MQLAHAGRKASTAVPWDGGGALSVAQGGWRPIVAPSVLAFDEASIEPQAIDVAAIDALVNAFAEAAQRALDAGFEFIVIYAAHCYLLHEFMSPTPTLRCDAYD